LRLKRFCGIAMGLVLGLCVAAPALAGTASVSGGVLSYTDSTAAANNVTVSTGTVFCGIGNPPCPAYTISDSSTPPTAGAGCFTIDNVAYCDTNVTSISISVGGGFDDVTIAAVFDLDPATINGGSGSDDLVGGPGNDTLDGGGLDGSIDTLAGGPGQDTFIGNATDTVTYATDADGVDVTLDDVANDGPEGEGDNVGAAMRGVIGGSGDDSITGGAGSNTLNGGEGSDILAGGGGSDHLSGEAGNDVLDGGAGNVDRIDGGAGADELRGGDGIDDLLDYQSRVNAVGVSIDGVTNDGEVGEQDNAVSGFEDIRTGDGNDVVVGSENDENISGELGDDEIDGAGGTDVLVGGDGNDRIDGGGGNDSISGEDGDDVASGGAGADVIQGSSGNDELMGGTGDDLLSAGAGNNVLHGGDDGDLLFNSGGMDSLEGGRGTDGVTFSTPTGVTVNLVSGSVSGGATATVASIENVTGSYVGDDRLTGNAAANVLSGGSDGGGGNDTINGAGGNDVLLPGLGNDAVTGGTGIDAVDYSLHVGEAMVVNLATGSVSGGGTDTLAEIENVTGGSGADTITGNAAANVLRGSSGNDMIAGAGGNDILAGNPGSDSLTGGGGSDTADYSPAFAAVTASLSAGTASGDGSDSLAEIENLLGSAFNDQFTGNSARNSLRGGAGNDSLLGAEGNDTLAGGLGDDVTFGGTGVDTATFASAAARVNVNLAAGAATGEGADTLAELENLTGSRFGDVLVGSRTANVLRGGAGADKITGGKGRDSLFGDSGKDKLFAKDGVRDRRVHGGTGRDGAKRDASDPATSIEYRIR
jgi:Ca2+-binding RTX toxin-like protein